MRGWLLPGIVLVLASTMLGGITVAATVPSGLPPESTFTVVWDHGTGAVRISPGPPAQDDASANAGCLAASVGEQWAREPPGAGACSHAWMYWPLATTIAVCSAASGCFIDAINWDDDGVDYIVLECAGAGGGVMSWGSDGAVTPTCETRTRGEPPANWTKWDSQILSFGGATSVLHVGS